MKTNKKGESISMTVIIIAAIALLVLVVLAVLVLRSSGGIKSGTDCTSFPGGVCVEPSDPTDEGGICGNDNLFHKASSDSKLGGCAVGEICCARVS